MRATTIAGVLVAAGAIGAAGWWFFVAPPSARLLTFSPPPRIAPPSPPPDAAPAPVNPNAWPPDVVGVLDLRRFDPIAFLPTALAHVRKTLPDAVLVNVTAEHVAADGTCDLADASRWWSAQYNFARSTAAVQGEPCTYHLNVSKDGVDGDIGAFESTKECGTRDIPIRCSIPQVLARIAETRPPTGRRTERMTYYQGEWSIAGYYERAADGTEVRVPPATVADWITIVDDCPAP